MNSYEERRSFGEGVIFVFERAFYSMNIKLLSILSKAKMD